MSDYQKDFQAHFENAGFGPCEWESHAPYHWFFKATKDKKTAYINIPCYRMLTGCGNDDGALALQKTLERRKAEVVH